MNRERFPQLFDNRSAIYFFFAVLYFTFAPAQHIHACKCEIQSEEEGKK